MLSAKPAEASPPTSSEPAPRAPHPSFFPFHIVPGVSNFRDIGGWPITSHSTLEKPRHVRRGVLFRGSDTTRITAAGIAKLQELHVKTDFDLRSKQQIEKAGGFKDMHEWGIERAWAPVFNDEEYTEEKARERYEMYASEDPAVYLPFICPNITKKNSIKITRKLELKLISHLPTHRPSYPPSSKS